MPGSLAVEERFFGVDRERVGGGADRLVVVDVDRFAIARRRPELPHAHERVLHDRQLVVVVAEIVEDAVHQPRRHRGASHRGGTGHGGAQAVAGHASDEIETGVHGLGQPAEVHAVADEVGPHGDDDVDGQGRLRCRLEQQLHERHGFVAGVLDLPAAAEAEQLLELVDEHQHVLVGGNACLPHRLDEAERAAPQGGVENDAVRAAELAVDTEHIRRVEGPGEVADRIVAWPHGGDPPTGTGAGHEATLQRRDQPRADER